jgi:hypothetical protein
MRCASRIRWAAAHRLAPLVIDNQDLLDSAFAALATRHFHVRRLARHAINGTHVCLMTFGPIRSLASVVGRRRTILVLSTAPRSGPELNSHSGTVPRTCSMGGRGATGLRPRIALVRLNVETL